MGGTTCGSTMSYHYTTLHYTTLHYMCSTALPRLITCAVPRALRRAQTVFSLRMAGTIFIYLFCAILFSRKKPQRPKHLNKRSEQNRLYFPDILLSQIPVHSQKQIQPATFLSKPQRMHHSVDRLTCMTFTLMSAP